MITNDMPESNVILVEFDPTNKIWPENEFEYLDEIYNLVNISVFSAEGVGHYFVLEKNIEPEDWRLFLKNKLILPTLNGANTTFQVEYYLEHEFYFLNMDKEKFLEIRKLVWP